MPKPKPTLTTVPPVEQVRSDLTTAVAEVRALRRLLVLAKEAEQARDLRDRAQHITRNAEGRHDD